MAVVDIWQSSRIPQVGVTAPQDRSGEIIGNAIANAGQAAAQVATIAARADAVQQQKNDSAWLGQQKPQSILDLNSKVDALNDPESQSYIDPTRPDYEATVGKTIDDYAESAAKTAPSADAQTEIRSYLTGLKASYVENGGQYADQSKLAKRISDIDESNRKWGSIIVTAPSQFGPAVQEQEKLIRSQGLSPEKTEAQVRKMKSTMAGFAMNGQASSNPGVFLKNISKWGEQGAEPGDIAQAQNIAEAELKRQQAEAKAESQRRQMQNQVDVTARASDAVSSVQANGGVMPLVNGKPLVTEKEIRAAYPEDPIRAQRAVDSLNTALKIGQAKVRVAGQTKAEDDAFVASVAPAPGGVFTGDDAEVQKAVIAAVNAKRDALADEIKQDIQDSQSESASAINQNGADWLQTAGVTGEVPEAAKVATAESGSAEAKAFLDKLEQTARLSKAAQQVKDQPNSADQSMADRLGLDIESTGVGSGDRAAEADATAKAIAEKQKAIAADPGGFFASANPGVKSGWEAVDANPNDHAVAENTVAMSVAAQLGYGLGSDQVQPFPNGRAAQFANTITSAPADQALSTIDYIRSIAGEPGLRQVLGQKGIPSMAKFMAFADQPSQEPVRAAALESMKLKPEELDKLVKDRGFKDKDIDEQVSARIEPLLNTLPPGAVGPYHDALTQITKFYVSKGMQPAAAAQQAWSAFESAYAFHDTFRVPRQINGAPVDDQAVQNGMNGVLQNLDKFNIVPQPGGPNMSAPLPSNPDLAAAVTKFPALAKVAGNVVVTDKPDPGDGRQLESYPPWEEYNPNPGKFTSEIYNQSAKGDERTSLVAGDMLHYLGAVDPATDKAVDPAYRAMKERLLSSMTPDQSRENHAAYKQAKEAKEPYNGTFDQFMDSSRGDEFIMGYITPDKQDDWRKSGAYTPQQAKILDEMKGYLSKSPEHDYALTQTIKQLQTGGARWVTNADDTGVVLTYDVDQNGIPGAAVKTANGRLEVLFTDLESGKYGRVQSKAHGRIGIAGGQ